MRFDPNSPKDMMRLTRSLYASYNDLEGFRLNRASITREYVGAYYNSRDRAGTVDMPVNMLALMVDLYLTNLAGASPQVMLVAANPEIKPFAADLEAVVNKEIRDIELEKILRQWVHESLFGLGVLKCGLIDDEYIELIPGQPVPTQKYYAEVIDLDDFAYDTSAPSFDKATWIANRYKVDEEAYEELVGKSKEMTSRESSSITNSIYTDQTRASDVGPYDEDDKVEEDVFVKQVALWDVWLPEHQLLVTVRDQREASKAVRVVEWQGPSRGPYHMLGYLPVPGTAMPLAPAQTVRSLNKTANTLFRKLVSQAARQKTLGLVRSGAKNDAKRIQKAKDGDLVPVEDPSAVTQVTYGGPSGENLAFAMQVDRLFNRFAGNLDAMGGLAVQADTASQERMIGAASGAKMAQMSRTVVDATVAVIEDFMFYLWNDPLATYETRRAVRGTSFEVPVEITPADRVGAISGINVKVEPYSMQYRPPEQRNQAIIQLLTTVIAPLLPYFEQQGFSVSASELVNTLAKNMDMPELRDIFETTGINMDSASPGQTRQSPVTHRTNERVSRSAGQDPMQAMMQMVGKGQGQTQ